MEAENAEKEVPRQMPTFVASRGGESVVKQGRGGEALSTGWRLDLELQRGLSQRPGLTQVQREPFG